MSELIVRGAYRFTSEDIDCVPCSGQPYCTPFIDGDKIAFQIPTECCGEVVGCESLTEECIDEQGIELIENATIEDGCVIIPNRLYSTAGQYRQIFMPYTFGSNDDKYTFCFCLTGFEGADFDIYPYISDGTNYLYPPVSGAGNYCIEITQASGYTEVGLLIVVPADFTGYPEYKICCLTICEAKEYTAELIDEEGEAVTTIPSTTNELGQEFSLSLQIPGEIPLGCYRIKVTNNCDETEYFSQCLAFTSESTCGDTLLIQYRNRNNAFGFDYSNSSYINSIRVEGRLKEPTFPDTSSVQTLSDNTNAVINSRVQMLWKVSLNDLPYYIHAALAVARRHSEFTIDGVPFVCAEGDYAPNWRRSSQYAPVEFEAFDQSFDGVSTYCG